MQISTPPLCVLMQLPSSNHHQQRGGTAVAGRQWLLSSTGNAIVESVINKQKRIIVGLKCGSIKLNFVFSWSTRPQLPELGQDAHNIRFAG